MSYSPTTQTIDEIVLDMNRISLMEFAEFMIANEGEIDILKRLRLTAEFATKVIVSWPFGSDISVDSYMRLGLYDYKRVDKVLNDVLIDFGKKNSPSS